MEKSDILPESCVPVSSSDGAKSVSSFAYSAIKEEICKENQLIAGHLPFSSGKNRSIGLKRRSKGHAIKYLG